MGNLSNISFIAHTNHRHYNTLFGIKQADRLLHTYIIGKTGTGKSTLLKNLMLQDVKHKRGFMLIDPHGDLVEQIYSAIPKYRKHDVVYINTTDSKMPYKYNPFKRVSFEKRSLVASGLLEIFQRLFGAAWGVRMEHILRYIILTLLDQPKASIEDIYTILNDDDFRIACQKHIVSKQVKQFWSKEFPKYSKADITPILNKVGAFLAHPIIRKVLIDNPHEISLRKIMDERKILLINLSKGHLGEDVTRILGSLFVTATSSATFSRIDTSENKRVPFFIFLDEFQNFTSLSLVNMLSELRKFKIGMILAHQYLHQLEDPIRKSILGNVGTLISFRVGLDDARYLAHEMYPVFESDDFINLPNYHIYLKLMIDGKPSNAFSGVTVLFSQL